MTILDNIKNVYFVGIGGIGMSALARYFKLKGYNVAGYDRTQTPLTEKMAREEGMPSTMPTMKMKLPKSTVMRRIRW